MKFHEASKDLVVASHGRGIYKVNLSPIHQLYQSDKNRKANILFEPDMAIRPKFNDTHKDPDYKTVRKLPITFYLKEAEQIELQIRNEQDSLIWTKTISASKGYNQYRWDLVLSREKNLQPYFVHYDKFIEEGTYQLVLISSDQNQTQALRVAENNGK